LNERLLLYDSLGSTNDEARRLLDEDSSKYLECIVIAKQQTSGRGRYGRDWLSPSGNLFMSVMTREVGAVQLSQFALLWGIAVQNVMQSLTKDLVQCKWPNDILINGMKVGGILIERHGSALIVGVGVNLEYYPEGVQFQATCLKHHSLVATLPEDLAQDIYESYEKLRKLWEEIGFQGVRDLWLKNAWKLHQKINIRQEAEYVVGIFETIDDNGVLILKDAAGVVHKLYVGDLIQEVKDVTSN
jgi:BirA family biotin operon repressor/biotin-[acetyl-CoA-carboxylase] ligase